MLIGVPKEIKNNEYRVGLTPASVKELTHLGHKVFVETQAGAGIGFKDEHYEAAGATVLANAQEVFTTTEMIIKVKEPQPQEYKLLREGQILFAYLHLAPDPKQTEGLIKSKCIAIAYETITDSWGKLPLLAPMSEIAGRMSVHVGASLLEKEQGGSGILLGGAAGVAPAKVVILGGGVAGTNAARIAIGMGANVVILDKNAHRLNELDEQYGSRLRTIFPNLETLEHYVTGADVVIGAVLITGAMTPKLVSADMVARMRKGSVLIDISIDQGGCFATSKPTSHTHPTYSVDGVTHYCVTNMPGAVARTSTIALNNATLPYAAALAQKGYRQALQEDKHLMHGLNVHHGIITHAAVAEALKWDYVSAEEVLRG
jgi:alanine dehydrogenase